MGRSPECVGVGRGECLAKFGEPRVRLGDEQCRQFLQEILAGDGSELHQSIDDLRVEHRVG